MSLIGKVMDRIDEIKLVVGCSFLMVALIGAFIAVCFQFDLFSQSNILGPFTQFAKGRVFDDVSQGGASNAPIFYGLIGISGAMLLGTIGRKK
jgi:hypothetical protein